MIADFMIVADLAQWEDFKEEKITDAYSFAFRIGEVRTLASYMGFFNSWSKPFSIVLKDHLILSELPSDVLCCFLFHPMYRKTGGLPLLILEVDNCELCEELLTHGVRKIDVELSVLGYKNCEYDIVTHCDNFSHVGSSAYSSFYFTSHGFEELSSKQMVELLRLNSVRPVRIFVEADAVDLPAIVKSWSRLQDEVYKADPSVYNFCSIRQSLVNELSDCQARFLSLDERYQSVMAYGGGPALAQSDASTMVEFYRTEYEILPTWYKRLGHIIKVLMGKRTFRSLYNDNVRKYKE